MTTTTIKITQAAIDLEAQHGRHSTFTRAFYARCLAWGWVDGPDLSAHREEVAKLLAGYQGIYHLLTRGDIDTLRSEGEFRWTTGRTSRRVPVTVAGRPENLLGLALAKSFGWRGLGVETSVVVS